MNAVNPYKPIYPVGNPPTFIGRVDLLREAVRVVGYSQGFGFIFYGQRRIGKTSILRDLLVRLPRISTFHPVYFDLLDKSSWSLAEIVTSLAAAIANQHALSAPLLGDSPVYAFAETWLPQFLSSLPEKHMLILLFDEFGALANPRTAQVSNRFYPFIRSLLDRCSAKVKFVAAVSSLPKDMSPVAAQIFQGLPSVQVSLFTRA